MRSAGYGKKRKSKAEIRVRESAWDTRHERPTDSNLYQEPPEYNKPGSYPKSEVGRKEALVQTAFGHWKVSSQ